MLLPLSTMLENKELNVFIAENNLKALDELRQSDGVGIVSMCKSNIVEHYSMVVVKSAQFN